MLIKSSIDYDTDAYGDATPDAVAAFMADCTDIDLVGVTVMPLRLAIRAIFDHVHGNVDDWEGNVRYNIKRRLLLKRRPLRDEDLIDGQAFPTIEADGSYFVAVPAKYMQ